MKHFQANRALVLALGALIGCQSTGPRASEMTRTPPPAAPATVTVEDLDDVYLVGPSASRELGFRIDWQTTVNPEADAGIARVFVQGDSVFVLDGRNFLTRLRREDGTRFWRIPVATTTDEIFGVNYLPGIRRVLVVTGGDLFVLDTDTGSLVDRQPLEQVASTAGVMADPFLVYGSRNGLVVWHSFLVGYQVRAYRVSPAIRQSPLLVGDRLIAVGSDGRILALDVDSASAVWDRYLLDDIAAQPTTAHGLVFVAGQDQYVWAFDLATGRRAWRHLTESPLESSPVVVGDNLYQQIPAAGLACFEAHPPDSPDGKVIWTSAEVTGDVVGTLRDRLITWDPRSRRVVEVEQRSGAPVVTVDLPDVRHLESMADTGAILAASDDGRVIRLIRR